MNVKVTKRLNATTQMTVEFNDERDVKEGLLKIAPFMQISSKCGMCGSENVTFSVRQVKSEKGEFIYPGQYCFDCKARRNMGEHKVPKGTLFFKKWEPPYQNEQVKEVQDTFGGEAI